MKSTRARLIDGHIPDSWILRFIDKEISSDDYEFVEEHLRDCSQCRAVEQQQRDIIDRLLEYKSVIVGPAALPSSHELVFESKLNCLASELADRRPFHRPIASDLFRSLADWFAGRNRVLAGAVLLLMATFAVFRWNVPAVSAKEMLLRSDAFEQDSIRGIGNPIIVQRILIRMGSHQSERTLYRDLQHNREVHEIDGNSEEDHFVDGVLRQASLNADELILPGLFLRASHKYKSSTFSMRNDGNNIIELAIHLPGYTIADADLTLRSTDCHTIRARLRLSDQSTIEISELSYQVVQLGVLRAGLFDAPIKDLTPAIAKVGAPNPVSDLASSEIRALAILHSLHAELGGEINIDDSDPRVVLIEGVVENAARKQEIVSALRTTPAVQILVETIAEKRTSLHAQIYEGHAALLATSAPPLLDRQLKEWFPAPEDRREYVRGVLSFGQSASSHAWVLDELSNHFSHARCLALRPEERKDLDNLLLGEASSLSDDIAGLKRQADMVLVESADTTTPVASPQEEHEKNLRQSNTADWHDQVRSIHAALDQVNDNLSTLLVGAGAGSASSDRLRSETYRSLVSLGADVQKFRGHLRQ